MKPFNFLFSKIKNIIIKNTKQQDLPPTNSDLPEGRKEKNISHSPYTGSGVTRVADEADTLIMRKKSTEETPASLLLLNGPKDLIGLSWPLIQNVTSVGRSSRLNDITIPHNSLSKTHFQIIKEAGLFYIVDLRSTNKTYINDTQIEPYQKAALENNSYIRASHLIFKFLDKGNIEAFSSKQILNKAQTDSLTEAGNRQLLKIKGPEYFFSNHNLSLIVFDIDNFKIINDNFGHTAGDYVLKTLAKYVLDIIRDGDLFIRYGGDEFCIFTPNSSSTARNIADRVEQKIQTNHFIFKDKKIPVNVSIGIAEKNPTDKAWEDIYHRADKHSYEKKRRKRAIQS